MSTDAVNTFKRFEIGDAIYQVKSLGLAEMISASTTIIRDKLRKELKIDARDYFPEPEEANERVNYILKTQKDWPKGDEMESLATDFMLSGHGMDELNIYALRRYNKKLREGSLAFEVYHSMDLEDQMEMADVVMGTFSETMSIYMSELSKAMSDKINADAEADGEIESEGDEKKSQSEQSPEQ